MATRSIAVMKEISAHPESTSMMMTDDDDEESGGRKKLNDHIEFSSYHIHTRGMNTRTHLPHLTGYPPFVEELQQFILLVWGPPCVFFPFRKPHLPLVFLLPL